MVVTYRFGTQLRDLQALEISCSILKYQLHPTSLIVSGRYKVAPLVISWSMSHFTVDLPTTTGSYPSYVHHLFSQLLSPPYTYGVGTHKCLSTQRPANTAPWSNDLTGRGSPPAGRHWVSELRPYRAAMVDTVAIVQWITFSVQ